MSRVHYQSRKRISKNHKHSKHGKLDMGVFHHETTPRNPTSSRRSIQPPTTEEMLAAIKNSPRPNACAMKGYILLCLLSLGLSIPELFELKWWENISSTATVLSWGPFAILCTSLFLTTLALCCVSRLFMGVAVVLSFLSLPCMVAQLAVCSTPAVLTMCCCFPSQCLLSLSHVSDELSKHVYLNETCRNLVPVQRNNHTCASSRAHFILFWISCATSLIFTSFLVTAQWYWIRSPSWRFKTNEDEVWDAMLPGSKLPPRRKIRLRDYHRQEDDEDDEGRDMDDYFEQEAESDSDSEEELTRRRTTRKHKKRKKKKRYQEYESNSGEGNDGRSSSSEPDRHRPTKKNTNKKNKSTRRPSSAEEGQKARTIMRMLSARKSEEDSDSESSVSSDPSEDGTVPKMHGAALAAPSAYSAHSSLAVPSAPSAPVMFQPPVGGGAAAAIKAKLAASRAKNNAPPTGGGGSQFFSPRETLQTVAYQNQ